MINDKYLNNGSIEGSYVEGIRERVGVSDVTAQKDAEEAMELTSKTAKVTINDVSKAKVGEEAEAAMAKATQKFQRWSGNTKLAGKLGLAAIGVGAILDISNRLHDHTQVTKMENQEEQQVKEKQIREDRAMRRMFGYEAPSDFGSIVTDMWNQRIGHYKMGNSKFQ